VTQPWGGGRLHAGLIAGHGSPYVSASWASGVANSLIGVRFGTTMTNVCLGVLRRE
jgi:hypothetical protein